MNAASGGNEQPGRISRWMHATYERIGARYPRRAFLGALLGGYLTGVIATAGTALYIDMSLAQFARLFLASWLLIWTPELAAAAVIGLGRLKPVTAWLGGPRDELATRSAWEAAADLPLALTRNPVVSAAAVPGMLVWGIYAKHELALPTYSIASSLPLRSSSISTGSRCAFSASNSISGPSSTTSGGRYRRMSG